MHYGKLIIALGVIGVSGCSSNSIRENHSVDISPYYDRVYKACIDQGDYKGRDEDAICADRAEYSMKLAQQMFWRYQSDNVAEKCGQLSGDALDQCAKEIQNQKYADMTDGIIKRNFSK